jgi:hypothetical protein
VGGASPTPHHGSLDAAVAWSYDLLSDEDQQVFRTVAVFDGDFDLTAASALAGRPVVDSVARLAASSLVVADLSVRPRRYRLLHVLRAWARAATPAEEARRLQRALELWAADLGRTAATELTDLGRAAQWMSTLDRERPNLDGALRSGLAVGDPLLTLQTAIDLAPLALRGRPREGLTLLLAALERAAGQPDAPADALAHAHMAAANLCVACGDVTAGLAQTSRAVSSAREAGLPDVAAAATAVEGFLVLVTGDAEGAERRGLESLAAATPGHPGARARAHALITLGVWPTRSATTRGRCACSTAQPVRPRTPPTGR